MEFCSNIIKYHFVQRTQMTITILCPHTHVLMFQRCIIIGLYYFLLKQVNNGKCITAVRGGLGFQIFSR